MVKGKLFFFIFTLTLLSSCSSRLLVSTKGCASKARWNSIERELSTSLGDKFATDIAFQKKYFDYVFIERIWTPLGQFSREKLFLKELLRLNGLNCSDVKAIEISYFNDYIDIITSAIPLLSSRSIMIKVISK